MNPRLRHALGVAAAVVAAVVFGWQIAEGDFVLPTLATVALLATVLIRLTRLPIDTILLGLVLVGYIVGNRGFAQLSLLGSVPLLPAELVLLVAVPWRAIVCGFERQLPLQRDLLNWAVLAWLVLGTARVFFDVPRFGLFALRDYAMVYYAVFFFLAQHMARSPRSARYLQSCLVFAGFALIPGYVLSDLFPVFFQQLTVRGVPLIFYKGDLVRTFLVVASLLLFHWARGPHRWWVWALSAALFVYVVGDESRASLLAAVVAAGLLLAARRWHYPAVQGMVGVLGLVAVMILAMLFGNPWAERKLDSMGDTLVSIVDFTGTRRYSSADYYKGDNNRFRSVWWKNVVTETWATNPVFGLGFGADLTRGFLQEYYPEQTEEFTVRSPHNINITIFGRMGLSGLLLWVVFCGVLLQRTWRSLRYEENPVNWSLWCGAWSVLVSASLGVVLEGPMGAVVFWTLIGLANASVPATAEKAPPAARPDPTDASQDARAASAVTR